MRAASRHGFLGSIRVQLVVWFLLIALVPLAAGSWVAHTSVTAAMTRLSLDRLASLTRERVRTLERYADERVRGLEAVAADPGILAALAAFKKAVAPDGRVLPDALAAATAEFEAFLNAFADAQGYSEVLLLSTDGRIVHAHERQDWIGTSLDDPVWKGSALARSTERVLMLVQAEIGRSELPPAGQEPAVWAVGPLISDDLLAGAVAVRLPLEEINLIVADRWGLGRTGEVVVASAVASGSSAQGRQLLVTGPLRGNPVAAFRQEVDPASELATRLLEGMEDAEGLGESVGLDGVPVFAAWSYVPSFGWGITAEIHQAEVLALLSRLRNIALASSVGFIAFVLFAAMRVAKRVSDPLRDAADSAARIAQGDLSTNIVVRGRGETHELLASIHGTIADLSALIARIQWSAGQIQMASAAVRRVAGQQDQVARELGGSSTQIAAATNQMHATSRELTATVGELTSVAERAAGAAGSGRSSLSAIEAAMRRLDLGSKAMAERLDEIRSRATDIDRVTTAITKVANQTNLLAVNAAIEAEKAGQHGLGFQVVAREIDRLASHAAASALEIEEILAGVQRSVVEGVRQVEQFGSTVSEGCETASGASQELGMLLRQVEELQASFTQVAVAVRAQSEGVAQVNQAMGSLVESAQRTASAVGEASSVSTQLETAAQALEGEVSKFRLSPSDPR